MACELMVQEEGMLEEEEVAAKADVIKSAVEAISECNNKRAKVHNIHNRLDIEITAKRKELSFVRF